MSLPKLPVMVLLVVIICTMNNGFCAGREDYQYALALLGERAEYELAAEKFEQFCADNPDNALVPRALHYLGVCYAKLGKDMTAAETYKKLVNLYPSADKELIRKSTVYGADAYFRAGKYKNAIELYTLLLEKYPQAAENEQGLYWRGECYSRLAARDKDGEAYVKAFNDFSKVIEDYPNSKLRADALYGAGVCAYDSKDYERGAKCLQLFEEENPKDKRAEEALFHAADCCYWLEDYQKAEILFDKVLNSYQGGKYYNDAVSGKGWCAYAVKDYLKAGAKFFEAGNLLGKSEKSYQAYYDAGVAYEQGKDKAKAVEALKLAGADDSCNPVRVKALARLGGIIREEALKVKANKDEYLAQLKAAEIVLTDAMNLAGNDYPVEQAARSGVMLGEIRYELGNYREAADAFLNVAVKWPDKKYAPFALYQLSLALAKLNDYTKAAESIRTMLVGFPENDLRLQAAYVMADYQSQLGQVEKSRSAYQWLADDGQKWAEKKDASVRQTGKILAAKSLLRLGESYNAGTSPEDIKKARECFVRIVSAYGDSSCVAAANLRLGEIAEKGGAFAEAGKYYREARSLADAAQSKVENEAQEKESKKISLYSWYRWAVSGVLAAQSNKDADKDSLLNEALKNIEEFIRANQSNTDAANLVIRSHYYRGEVLYVLKRKQEAIADYLYCYEHEPEGSLADAALFGLCWSLNDSGRKKQAQARMQELIEKYPTSEYVPETLLAIAANYREFKENEKALEVCNRVLASAKYKKFFDRAVVEQARNFIALKEPQKAIVGIKKFIKDNPSSSQMPEALYTLSWAQWAVTEPLYKISEDAKKEYEDFTGGVALKDLDGERGRKAEFLKTDWEKKLQAARNREAGMIETLDSLRKNYPDFEGAGNVALRLGESAYDRKAYANAFEYYQEAINKGNKSVLDKAYYRIGWCSLRMSENAEDSKRDELRKKALYSFIEVCNTLPESPLSGECAWRSAELLRESGDYKKAIWYYDYAKKSSNISEISMGVDYGRALTLLEMKEYASALKSFREFLDKYQDSKLMHEACWGAGYASYNMGANADAREYYLKAKADEYGGEVAAKSRYGLGLIAMDENNLKLAREEFRKVDVFHSHWREVAAAALLKAAEASRKMGDEAAALKDIQRVIKRYQQTTQYKKANEFLSSAK